MKIFVISLNSAIDRRKHICTEFDKQNISFNFFDAITINQIDNIEKKLDVDLSLSNLTRSEKSCFLSHLSLWIKLLESNENYITIFEDDVVLSSKNINFFLENHEWIPPHVDILKIDCFSNKVSMNPKTYTINKRKIRQLKGVHLGAAGYILNRKSAFILINYIRSKKQHLPIDHILFEEALATSQLNISQLNPALCAQSDRIVDYKYKLKSQLESDRQIRQKNFQRPDNTLALHLKVIREVKRISTQLNELFSFIYFK